MQFVPASGGVWLLVDENAPPDASLIATIRSPVELLALKGVCEARLTGTDLLKPFTFSFEGRTYLVTTFADRGGHLSLKIESDDGSLGRVETEFVFQEIGNAVQQYRHREERLTGP